jgi:hypothetical protein
MYSKDGKRILARSIYDKGVGEEFSLSVYNKGRRGILSIVQQGWERDSLCQCTVQQG